MFLPFPSHSLYFPFIFHFLPLFPLVSPFPFTYSWQFSYSFHLTPSLLLPPLFLHSLLLPSLFLPSLTFPLHTITLPLPLHCLPMNLKHVVTELLPYVKPVSHSLYFLRLFHVQLQSFIRLFGACHYFPALLLFLLVLFFLFLWVSFSFLIFFLVCPLVWICLVLVIRTGDCFHNCYFDCFRNYSTFHNIYPGKSLSTNLLFCLILSSYTCSFFLILNWFIIALQRFFSSCISLLLSVFLTCMSIS